MWVKVGPEALPLSVEVYSLCFDKEVKWSVYINNCSVLYKPVDVMLCSMFAVWHFEYTSHAEQGFLCIPVCYHLCGGRRGRENITHPETAGLKHEVTRVISVLPQSPGSSGAWLWELAEVPPQSNRESKLGQRMKLLKGHHVGHSLCFRSPVGRLLPVFPTQELINTTNLCSTVTQPQ